ncbi:MAG: cysteine hydrolase [Rhodospirillales bacterium]|nr:cysteine hydrolase [Rhodospirillales bacterium]
MHHVAIRQEIIDRVIARRGRFHLFDRFAAAETALVVIDMQPTFVAPDSPAEVPASRGIVDNINILADALRARGAAVIWVTHANSRVAGGSDWNGFFDRFVAKGVRDKTVESLAPGSPDTLLWDGLNVQEDDLHIFKNRYSALIPGSSSLERVLRGQGIHNILIAGTKTNVCCEATGRDAMMLDFSTVMVSDCLAALSDEEHLASLETFIQQFGDVLSYAEVLELVGR